MDSAWYWERHLQESQARDATTNEKCPDGTFSHPGIPYWAYELHPRIPDLMAILRVAEDCSMFGRAQDIRRQLNQSSGRTKRLHDHNLLPFLQSMELKVSRAMYDPAVPKWPLTAKTGHGYRSGPFVTGLTEIMAPGSDEPLVVRQACACYVDAETRKMAKSLPQWYTDAVDGTEMLDQGLRVERLKRGSLEAYTRKYWPLISDIDHLNHVNYSVYIRECHNTLRQAITEKEFSQPAPTNHEKFEDQKPGSPEIWMTSAIMRQGVKTVRVRYVKEVKVAETVFVSMWQEKDKPFWVFFVIEGGNSSSGDVRFEMSLEYFSPISNL